MIIVTGGAGFIGSNLIHALNAIDERDILCVDNLTHSQKFHNLQSADYADYMDKQEFRAKLLAGEFDKVQVRAIFHQGACSSPLEDDGRYMLDNNYTYSKEILSFAARQQAPLVYASTAALYGNSPAFAEVPANEHPLNVYAYSKLLFDNLVRRVAQHPAHLVRSTVVGLRYFNAYGPREQHKGRNASVIHHFARQLRETGTVKLFQGSGGYANGEQRRDFIFAQDLCHLNLFFAGLLPESPKAPIQAILNAGTGTPHTYNQVAQIVMQGQGTIDYIPIPADLENRYQHNTHADTTALRATGYTAPFTTLEEGIAQTLQLSH